MHPSAIARSHALRRIMERLPGVCPGLVLRDIDDLVDAGEIEPILSDDASLIYRVGLTDGRIFVAIMHRWTRQLMTVMPTPCDVHAASRRYRVGAETLEKIKNVNRKFSDDQRRIKRQKRTAQIRLL